MPKSAHRHGLGQRLRSPSTLILIGLNLLIYVLLLRWVGENIQLEKLTEYFGKIPLWALLGSLLINMLALSMYGVRMALLLGRGFHVAFTIVNIGYTLNTLLPLRLGEGIKLYLSRRLFKVPLTGIFSASVAEKLIDLTKFLLLGAAAWAFAAGEFIDVSSLLVIGIFILLAIAGVALFRRNIVRIVRLLPRKSRLRRVSIELHKHAGGYPLGRIVAVTICIGLLNIALVFFTFNTYLPEVRIDLLESIVLLVIIALVIAIPSAPAGIGLFEAGIVAYLTQKSGIDAEAALAAASVFHLVITLPQLFVTAGLMWCQRGRLIQEAPPSTASV